MEAVFQYIFQQVRSVPTVELVQVQQLEVRRVASHVQRVRAPQGRDVQTASWVRLLLPVGHARIA
jgi:hypothetical protein